MGGASLIFYFDNLPWLDGQINSFHEVISREAEKQNGNSSINGFSAQRKFALNMLCKTCIQKQAKKCSGSRANAEYC